MSWQQLLEIKELNREEYIEFASEKPVACPYDGEPLEVGPNGELHCPAGDYVYE